MIELSESRIYDFEEFRLDAKSHRLFRRATSELVPLTPKAVEVLIFLVENAGKVLSKNELIEKVWENSFVEDANLSQTIFVLRKTLGEDTKNPRFILTAPNRGYEFIAEVKRFRPEDEILEESFLSDESKVRSPKSRVSSSESEVRNPQSAIRNPQLKWLLVPLVLLISLGIYWYLSKPTPPPTAIHEIKTIAILPFTNIGGKSDEEYLGQGLSEVLISKLSNVKTIVVRPNRAVQKYSDASPDPKKIGSELDVEAILIGRVQKIDENIRVTVQLVRTSDGATLWAQTFDDKFTNIFAVQDSISARVTESLAIKLGQDERRMLAKNYTANTEAFQLYLQGLYLWNKRTPETLMNAINQFEKAKEIDPNYALAYVGLANCYVVLSNYGAMTPHEAFPKAKEYIKKALEIDDQLAEAHAALADMQVYYDWDWAEAEKSFKRALELNPNYATAHQWYAEFLFDMARFDESFAELNRALEIEPRSPVILTARASRYFYLRQYDKVIEETKKIHEIDPNYGYSYFHLSLAYENKGMDKEAAEANFKAITLLGEPPECVEELKTAFKNGGLRNFWVKRAEQLETRPHLKNFPPNGVASVYVRLGDKEKALEWLEKGFQKRDPWMVGLKVAIHFDALKDDPRYQNLLRRMNF